MEMLLSCPDNARCLAVPRLIPHYICSNNLYLVYRNPEKIAGNACLPSYLWIWFSVETVWFATVYYHIYLDCFYFLVLWEGDTKVIMLGQGSVNSVSITVTRWLVVTLVFYEFNFLSPLQCLQLPSLLICPPIISSLVSLPHIISVFPCSSCMSPLFWEVRLRKEQSGSREQHRADAGLKIIWRSHQNSWMVIIQRQDIPFPSKHFCVWGSVSWISLPVLL